MSRPMQPYDRALLVSIGGQIRRARVAAGVGLDEIARNAGLERGTADAVERGHCKHAHAYYRISLALEVSRVRFHLDLLHAHVAACEAIGVDPTTTETACDR